eukprot:CAMPEP_0202452048 /NCGR_PEP_ID=MMETSP1360-20130828/10331_1 /ASSEMBLY_ACC=CAM_ASM_000848 /TAXON_ID=515479 /ORGANISM="Licmophora paradoxa, Strain CCMP2313" /LENGTH=579 /DNA_ID=CAMNT_0049070763 /DNA_START=9 /DNA_END=1748 /DNA_ORIENTATION=+
MKLGAAAAAVAAFVLSLAATTKAFTSPANYGASTMIGSRQSSEVHGLLNFFFDEDKKENEEEPTVVEDALPLSSAEPPTVEPEKLPRFSSGPKAEEVDICVIGGGVAGLTAALTAAEGKGGKDRKILLLEGSPTLGGRVQSDVTEDGFILDRGFAVFIEEYPIAKKLLDYDKLALGKFQPGALVKLRNRIALAKVADPLRQPEEIFVSALSPVGSILDKALVLPLLANVFTKSTGELFEEAETSTIEALTERWGFGEDIIEKFFKPFLEGIYLAPLEEQSSRMFSFVFKMFSEGAATLPTGGIGAVSQQLKERAEKGGVELRVDKPVGKLVLEDDGCFIVETNDRKEKIKANCVIVATDGRVAEKVMAEVPGFESLDELNLPKNPQREVGCLYYALEGAAPVEEPILILSGMKELRGSEDQPINNVCFPSVVNPSYAPAGKHLCSVTILKNTMDAFKGRESELDVNVRAQLANFFPDFRQDILEKWELKRIYSIPNAQPGQYKGPFPANINGGRPCTTFRGKETPKGLLLCGDHMASATLNGALESGLNAGKQAATFAAAAAAKKKKAEASKDASPVQS